MAERGVVGAELSETYGANRAIERVTTSVTAFVGRTLKGPVSRPVPISSFSEFQQIFGGLWQPSTVSYAVEQFFENGGQSAIIVRVVNGARPPTVVLPAGTSQLRLLGVNPGSREYLRASVDYDAISDAEPDRFNLVIQRVRSPGTELIEDQEIFRRLSVEVGSARFVTDMLVESRVARVVGAVPPVRPDRTAATARGPLAPYMHSNSDGDDGDPITDYDVIGSALDTAGMFALRTAGGFNLMCIPPLARDHDVGLSTLLVAARFCREQNAMLLVDPPSEWTTPYSAMDAFRTWPFRSENAVMFYPRVLAFDRLRNRNETFGSSAAAAGMIARSDEQWPLWTAAEADESVLRPGLRPAIVVADSERSRLAHVGINTLVGVRTSHKSAFSACTLAAGRSCAPEWKYLAARRVALFIMASVERGTRWLLHKANTPDAWALARDQVEQFLDALDQEGAFAGGTPEESYFVICDERVNPPEAIAQGKTNVLFGFAATRPSEFHTCLVTQQLGHSRVRPVTVNRQATAQQRVEWEIETAILRN